LINKRIINWYQSQEERNSWVQQTI